MSNLKETQDSPEQSKFIDKHTLADIGENWPHYEESSLLEDAVLHASEHAQVAYEMALSSALGVMSAACQGLVDVAYPNGHSTSTSLFILILAKSGERKTSLDSLLTKPLSDFQKIKNEEFEEAKLKHQRQLSIWKIKEKELEKKLRTAIKDDKDTAEIEQQLDFSYKNSPLPPKDYKLIYGNVTQSALTFSMYEKTPLAFLLSNEAGLIFKGHVLQDLSQLNSLWDGADITVDRRTTESFTLSGARLSASIMVQPGIFKKFVEKRGDEATDSGFFARFLVVYPDSKIGQRGELSPPLEGQFLTKFHDRVLERIKQSVNMIKDGEKKTILRFTKSAQVLWKEINKSIEIELNSDAIYTHALGHGCKLMENISRIAAIIHTFETDKYNSEIDRYTLFYAYKLSRHYSKDYMRYIAGTPEVVKNASRLVKAIKKYGEPAYNHPNSHPYKYTFTRSAITQNAHQEIRSNDNFNNAIELIRRLGHLKINKSGNRLQYEFSDDTYININSEPELKNGELYYVEDIPKFSAFANDINGRFGREPGPH